LSENNDRIKFADSYYGMQKEFDKLYELSKEGKEIKNLMEIITSPDNIKLAYRNIKSNKGSKTVGVDNRNIYDIEKMSGSKYVTYIENRLKNYQPMDVRRVMIPKANGKLIPLGIPTISDRIVQQCIKQVIEPICEAKFHKHSYGFRPNRDTSHALFRMQHLINNSQLHYCIDVDIKSFFDEVDHGKLLKQLWSIGIKDKRLIKMISKMLKCKVDGVIQNKGTSQGGILSPILANVVLNEFDWWISNQYETMPLRDKDKHCYSWYFREKKKTELKEVYIVRYADDFKLMCRDYVTAVKMLEASKKWLKERLGLTVSSEKTKIINLRKNYSDFLGVKMKAKSSKGKFYATSRIGNKRKEIVKNNIKNAIKMVQRFHDSRSVYKYNIIVMGIHNYYSRATNVFKDMKRINYSMIPVLRNRLKNLGSLDYQKSDYESFQTKYFYKGSYKTWKVNGEAMIPICDVQYKTNVAFKQEKCNYTKQGRELLNYRKLGINHELNVLRNEIMKSDNLKLYDNKISRFSMQNGLCEVSKLYLGEGEREIHHKLPKQLGGSDNYSNICWLNKDVHKLIHIIQEDLIQSYLENVCKNSEVSKEKLILRINKLRAKANMKPILLA
jgi:group II intron reverse transcriptase/maturase